MPWKEVTSEELAKSLNINLEEIREKQRLMELIKKVRKEKYLSQAALAKKVGVTQSRIAQIESKVETSKVSFEILFGILKHLGYECRIITKKASLNSA